MNTNLIIMVSVLSTLGAVALITSIVVAFYKLGKKVDVDQWTIFNDDLMRSYDQRNNDLYDMISRDKSEMLEYTNRQIDNCNSLINGVEKNLESKIDSRCDKLKSEIEDLKHVLRIEMKLDSEKSKKKDTLLKS